MPTYGRSQDGTWTYESGRRKGEVVRALVAQLLERRFQRERAAAATAEGDDGAP
jgi:hypothetical protein